MPTNLKYFKFLETLILTSIKRDPRYMDWGLKITQKTIHPHDARMGIFDQREVYMPRRHDITDTDSSIY